MITEIHNGHEVTGNHATTGREYRVDGSGEFPDKRAAIAHANGLPKGPHKPPKPPAPPKPAPAPKASEAKDDKGKGKK